MAFEIPSDDVDELQISLRKHAGLPSYNPEDPALPKLPSFADSISELDPSPAYLRCKHCKGRLLRGINSMICLFCGRNQHNKDTLPQPIKFMSTFGCRWLLQSLDLDGSEIVGPLVEGNESNRGRNAPQNEFPLSELLDLEVRWPSEDEKLERSVSDKTLTQKLSTLNLAGVDLENFFAEAKPDSVSVLSEEQFALNKHNDGMGSNAFQGHGNLSLFENVQPSETGARSKEDESSDSFSGWEANFQSAGSATQQQESKSFDPSVGSSSDLSAHMDAIFVRGKDLFDDNSKENATSASDASEWFKGDAWSNSNMAVTGQAEQLKVPTNGKDGRSLGNETYSSMNIDWIQDELHAASSRKAADNRISDEDDDAWNDFASSTNVQGANHMTPSAEQASETNLFSGTINSQDIDFGSFMHPDFNSGTFNNQNGSTEVNVMQPEASLLDGMHSENAIDGESAEGVEKSGVVSNGNTSSKEGDLEALMSQMHDLSFMLESNLSVPQKTDPQKTDLFSPFSRD